MNQSCRQTASDLTLCVFIDALGWRLQSHYGFLDDILRVKTPLDTVLGYSSTCDPTILTGKPPREHNHFAFFRYAPEAPSFSRTWRMLDLLPKSLTRRGRVRHHLSRLTGRLMGWKGYFQLYNVPFGYLPLMDYSEKKDIYEPGGINGGQPTFFDRLRESRIPFHRSDWRRCEQDNLRALERDLRAGQIQFAYLYLAELDGILHAEGTTSHEVERKIRWYEERLRHLMQVARQRYPRVRLLVFSDHGMTDVLDTSDLMVRIEALGWRFGTDYAAVYDSTIARFWFLDERAREQILAELERENRGQVLEPDDLVRYGCDFDDDSYGDLFFLMKPGVILCPSFMGSSPPAGMHGFAPEHIDSVAMFGSNEPARRIPSRLEDLHDVVLEGLAV